MASNDKNNTTPEEALLALAQAAQLNNRQAGSGKRLSVNLPTSPTQATAASQKAQPNQQQQQQLNAAGLSPAPSDVSAALTLLESSMDSMTKFQLQQSTRRSTETSSGEATAHDMGPLNQSHPLRKAAAALQQSQTSVMTFGSSMESLATVSGDEDDGEDSGGEDKSTAGGAAQKKRKRFRRRYYEIERVYKCNWPGCTKAYGTLNHLNHHINLQKHGPKRKPAEFAELRQIMKAQKLLRKAGIDSQLVPQVLQGQTTASIQVQQQPQAQQQQDGQQQPQPQQMVMQHPSLSRQSSLSGSMMGMLINQQQSQQPQFQQKPMSAGPYGMSHHQFPPAMSGSLHRHMPGTQSSVLPMQHHRPSFGNMGHSGTMDPLLNASFSSAPGSLAIDRRDSNFRTSAPSIKIQTMLPPGLDNVHRHPHQQHQQEPVNLPALSLPQPSQQSQQPNSGSNDEVKLPSIDRLLH